MSCVQGRCSAGLLSGFTELRGRTAGSWLWTYSRICLPPPPVANIRRKRPPVVRHGRSLHTQHWIALAGLFKWGCDRTSECLSPWPHDPHETTGKHEREHRVLTRAFLTKGWRRKHAEHRARSLLPCVIAVGEQLLATYVRRRRQI